MNPIVKNIKISFLEILETIKKNPNKIDEAITFMKGQIKNDNE